ncbi:MAG TPA: cytidine deaminase [Kandleria vitulina]|jgi:dCMP deaminase|nr:cytidine deaminase [Kandleria vitulina]
MEKRKDYISWDEYFMGVAVLSGLRSKDPNTQVGACVASDKNKVLTMGYNGMPIGIKDEDMPWGGTPEDGNPLNSKYLYVCHAEFNAILNSRVPLDGSRIYVTLFPCNECAKAIVQSGIKEVIYTSDKYADTVATKASKKIFDLAGVKYRKFAGRNPHITFTLED